MENVYNNTFLNSLFTSEEFEFMKHLDSDVEKLDALLKSDQEKRDIIVKLINGLNDTIYDNNVNQKNNDEDIYMLSESKKIFEKVNNNISMLQINKEISDSINKQIIDLLIKIENDGNDTSENKYIDEIVELKNKIADFSNVTDELGGSILENQNAIEQFLKNPDIQKYLNSFSIKYTEEVVNPVNNSKSDFHPNKSNLSYGSFNENNNCLLISEKTKKVFLPYSKTEVLEYLEKYPNQYKSFSDVVKKEFIYPIDYYVKHPAVSRFREAYSLIRDREAKSILDAFKFAMDIMFHYSLNPAIIAACKSQSQLENYLKCLTNKKLDDFTDFEIKFEVTPLKVERKKH